MSAATVALILKLLDLLALGMATAPAVLARYRKTRGLLDTMIKEGRDPTAAEMDELDASIRDLRDQLHS